MKKMASQFVRRGMIACGLGPLILAAIYLILHQQGRVQTLTVHEVCLGIVSLSVLAFIVGGMNVIYQIERLPVMVAILIHGCVLYSSYLITYLLNGWLEQGIVPILVFSGIFIFGFFAIWAIIYSVMKRKTEKLNQILKQKQQIEQ